jgi:AsmA protein
MSKLLRNVVIAIAVIVVILFALPFFINVNSFKPKIESELSAALARKSEVGNLSLSILGGSVTADNISIADDPAFSKSPFLTAKSLTIGVELLPLIFSKELHVTGITLDEPSINVISNAKGAYNFQSIGGTAPKSASAAPSSSSGSSSGGGLTSFSVAELKVNNGKLVISRLNSSAKPLTIERVNIVVKNFSATTQFPFTLSALLAGSGKLNLEGKAGPLAPAGTPVEAAVKLADLNLAAIGADPSVGLGGTANLDGTLNSDGKNAKINGTLTLDKLKLSPKGTPAPKQVAVKFATTYNTVTEAGTLSQGDISAGKALAHLTGGYRSQGEATLLNMKFDAPGLPVDDVESLLPALGVTLPSGSGLKGGTLSANLGISGPTDKLVIAGPVKLENSSLTGFDLGGKLGALSAFTGKTASSKDTVIQNASTDARMAPEGTKLDNINVNVPSLGTVTGSGTISPDNALNFHMVANLSGAGGEVTKLVGIGGKGGGGLPFMIEGTTSDPKFVPDVKGIAGSAIQQAITGKTGIDTKNPASALGGLLKKKP